MKRHGGSWAMGRTLREQTDARLGLRALQTESHEPLLLFSAPCIKEQRNQESLSGALVGSQAGFLWLSVGVRLLEMRSAVSLDGQERRMCPTRLVPGPPGQGWGGGGGPALMPDLGLLSAPAHQHVYSPVGQPPWPGSPPQSNEPPVGSPLLPEAATMDCTDAHRRGDTALPSL